MTFNAGDRIGGKYRIVRLIGDGGMGSVYEARHELLGIPVALKFLHPELAKRAGLAARFLQEARVSATIQSPHVAHVTDVDTAADGSPYLVMELLKGESLQSLMNQRGKLERDQALDFALQILLGLEVAHAMGVVHRDLKPDNVFVTPSAGGSLLKLIDFGIAKLKETSEYKKEITRAGVVMGTPEYMAPEQLYAAHQVDLRADLFSLGVMLFEMLSGTRPVEGDSPEMLIANVVQGNMKQLSVLEPTLPSGLVQLVERALKPDREHRFSSAAEFRLELARFAGELSPAGRLAVAEPPVAPKENPAALPNDTAYAPPISAGVPDTVDGPEARAVPRTLPPDDAGRLAHASTQAGPPPAEIARGAWVPPVQTSAARPPERRRRRSPLLWIVASASVLLGAGLGIYFATESFRTVRKIPDLPPPDSTFSGAGSIGIAPLETRPTPDSPPAVPRQPSIPAPKQPTSRPQPGSVEPSGGRTSVFPLPFPSFALPSSLPPLPSGFPTALPTSFPTALPSFLPPFPGLTPPAPIPAPGSSSQATQKRQ
jgi:serine/threonine-protein kinase